MDYTLPSEDYRGRVAVIGMSCRFPGANSPAEFWDLLSKGNDAIRPVSPDRPYLRLPGGKVIKAGFLSCPLDEFDAKFFGICPREALFLDPQQRILLEVTWESLEAAGINPHSLRDSNTVVFIGLWESDYEKIILKSQLTEEESRVDFLHVLLGNKLSATASRISFSLGLNGPALAVETGCSSSLNAVHLACQSLLTRETDLSIAGGVNLILSPFNPVTGRPYYDYNVVLAKDSKCKTFDESADGFVRWVPQKVVETEFDLI
jgi:acyl transferase domain-containing protein